MPDPEFGQMIRRNLNHWLSFVYNNPPPELLELEHSNILLAVQYGLELDDTLVDTTRLLLELFQWIERYGVWEVWLPVFQQALQYHESTPYWQIRLLNIIGHLHRLNGQLSIATETHYIAHQLAVEFNELELVVKSQLQLAEDYWYTHQMVEAETHALKAQNLLASLNKEGFDAACVFNRLGMIARNKGSLVEAENYLQRAVQIQRALEQPIWLVRCLNNLAIVLQESAKFSEALGCYQEVEGVLAQAGNTLDWLNHYNSLGTAHSMLGNWQAAESMFRQAEYLLQAHPGRMVQRGVTTYNLANSLYHQGRFIEAREWIQRSVVLWRKVEDVVMLARALGVSGEILVAQGQVAEASVLYDEAIVLLKPYAHLAHTHKLWNDLLTQRQTLDGVKRPF